MKQVNIEQYKIIEGHYCNTPTLQSRLRCKPKKRANSLVCNRLKRFCKNISPHRNSRNIFQTKDLVFHLLPKPVILRQEMPHPTVMLRVLSNANSRLIVKPKRRCTRRRVTEFRREILEPHSIRASLISSNVLRFSSRLSNNRLSLRAPIHQALANKDSMATCRTCRVYITRIVHIRINLQTRAILSRTVAKHKVLCAGQILEDMLYLFPVRLSRIRIKAT